MSAIAFDINEACRVLGRSVRLIEPYGKWPRGSYGRVVDIHPFKQGYVIEVLWDTAQRVSMFPFEYFTKDDFETFLIEC